MCHRLHIGIERASVPLLRSVIFSYFTKLHFASSGTKQVGLRASCHSSSQSLVWLKARFKLLSIADRSVPQAAPKCPLHRNHWSVSLTCRARLVSNISRVVLVLAMEETVMNHKIRFISVALKMMSRQVRLFQAPSVRCTYIYITGLNSGINLLLDPPTVKDFSCCSYLGIVFVCCYGPTHFEKLFRAN